ncbi:hypothetical protein BY458DRAFT_527384 [Sporodiniella umbellata]|nr:hypothetical protein BY458DRAFT_527384 [Sporodiniella umbellata]
MISRPQPVCESSETDLSGKRTVIPSKRAAQNRAAQKAFRQRRDQYIKELETKASAVKETQTEVVILREENVQLRERVVELERQILILSGKDRDPSRINGDPASEPFSNVPPILNTGYWQDNVMEIDLAFDPFVGGGFGAMNNELITNTNNDQVLDDLFAVLQTRQRPQILDLNELESS